jgi:formylmethanofuran dehydrogenase subunit B
MGLLAGVVSPNVANFNCSIIVPIVNINIKKTKNTRNRDMVALVVAIKSKEEQGTTMAMDTIDGQIPTSVYGQSEEQTEIMATRVEDGRASNSKFIIKDSRTLGG